MMDKEALVEELRELLNDTTDPILRNRLASMMINIITGGSENEQS